MEFSIVDLFIFIGYIVLIVFLGLWFGRKKKSDGTANDYFLAGNKLTWWAIGASIIAANISAEQMIGMSGSGFKIGLAIASYEWMAAISLIVVAKFIMPVFIKKHIYTMPQFLEERYDSRVRTTMAVFWIIVYIFVNLTSILYLGALSLKNIMGIPLIYGIIGLAFLAALYSIYGGLKSVAWTDIVQVVMLIVGGLATTYVALNLISGGEGIFKGFNELYATCSDKFHMIIKKGDPNYKDLPGLSVIIGGMWIANISYFGFNQYIIQRGLAAKSLDETQKGLVFAGFLKILIPIIVVVPGIAAYFLNQKGVITMPANNSDAAYPLLVNLLPVGIKGLAFAALTAAIISSLASMLNSTSTIFTLDIYNNYINKKATDKKLILIGRITSITALILAVITAKPLLGNLDQAFQYIQDFTGFVTPGICVIFLFGMFWKKMSANAALSATILTFVFSALFRIFLPQIPFLNRMGYVFIILCVISIIISYFDNKKQTDKNAIDVDKGLFKTSISFNIWSLIIVAIISVIYIVFW